MAQMNGGGPPGGFQGAPNFQGFQDPGPPGPQEFLNAIQMGMQNLTMNAMNTNQQMAGLANQVGILRAEASERDEARDAQHAAALAGGMLGGGGGARDGGDAGYRALKPKKEMTKVNAEDARKLMTEMAQFEVDL